jgi:hypothetical protein
MSAPSHFGAVLFDIELPTAKRHLFFENSDRCLTNSTRRAPNA